VTGIISAMVAGTLWAGLVQRCSMSPAAEVREAGVREPTRRVRIR
jgi:hypothetical protein